MAQVPSSFWQPAERAQSGEQWKKWIGIFLIVTVVLPTCLGLLGAIIGIGGGIFAAVIPFIIALLAG